LQEQLNQAEANLRVNQASLSQAMARYKELEAQYRRTETLAKEGLSSQVELETLGAQTDSALATIELAKAQIQESESQIEEVKTILSKTEIRAPITGTIGRRNAEVGMQVGTNSQLFTIGDLGQLRVEVVLTSNDVNKVRVGQRVRVYPRIAGPGRKVIDAKLSRISPFLDPVTRSTEAEIDIGSEGTALRPGMSVIAEIHYGEGLQATLLPTSTLFTHPNTGEEGVFVLSALDGPPPRVDGSSEPSPLQGPVITEFLPVEVRAEGRMEIGVSRVDPDTWVVTVGQNLLAEGKKQAMVRPTSWDRVMELQSLQREDLLESVLKAD
jgi:RND family efflux transporter MFP subunit